MQASSRRVFRFRSADKSQAVQERTENHVYLALVSALALLLLFMEIRRTAIRRFGQRVRLETAWGGSRQQCLEDSPLSCSLYLRGGENAFRLRPWPTVWGLTEDRTKCSVWTFLFLSQPEIFLKGLTREWSLRHIGFLLSQSLAEVATCPDLCHHRPHGGTRRLHRQSLAGGS